MDKPRLHICVVDIVTICTINDEENTFGTYCKTKIEK